MSSIGGGKGIPRLGPAVPPGDVGSAADCGDSPKLVPLLGATLWRSPMAVALMLAFWPSLDSRLCRRPELSEFLDPDDALEDRRALAEMDFIYASRRGGETPHPCM